MQTTYLQNRCLFVCIEQGTYSDPRVKQVDLTQKISEQIFLGEHIPNVGLFLSI